MKKLKILGIITLILTVCGCSGTKYSRYDDMADDNLSMLSRVVKFEITDAFYRVSPACIVVLPAIGIGNRKFKKTVENAVARHLSGKIERVIGHYERRNLERKLVFDLSHQNDRGQFAGQSKCSYFLLVNIRKLDNTYAVVWSQRSLVLDVRLHGVDEAVVLWRASHQTSRGEGGLPLSPISFGAAVFTAGRANGDMEIFPSMLDDSFRRMFAKFPDTREY